LPVVNEGDTVAVSVTARPKMDGLMELCSVVVLEVAAAPTKPKETHRVPRTKSRENIDHLTLARGKVHLE
jgi:hypothetical protein